MQKFTDLTLFLETAKIEAEAFYNKGNKAAGTRLRNAMQDIKIQAQHVREDVLETQKSKNTD